MKERIVVFSPEARNDLFALHDRIAEAAGPETALSYVERLEAYCRGFATASERGNRRDDIREGLHIVGFERRITIAFAVDTDRVTILRLFHAGRNWEEVLS